MISYSEDLLIHLDFSRLREDIILLFEHIKIFFPCFLVKITYLDLTVKIVLNPTEWKGRILVIDQVNCI